MHDPARDQSGALGHADPAALGLQHGVGGHVVLGGRVHGRGVPAVLDPVVDHPTGHRGAVDVHVEHGEEHRDPEQLTFCYPCVGHPLDGEDGAVAGRQDGGFVGRGFPLGVAEERGDRGGGERGEQPELRLRPGQAGGGGQAERDTGGGHAVGVDVHGSGQRDAGRPVRGGQPFRHLARGVPEPVHPDRWRVAQHQVGTGAVEGRLPGQLARRAVGQGQYRHRQHPAGGQILGQPVEVAAHLGGVPAQWLGQHHEVGRVRLGQRVHHPQAVLAAQLVPSPCERYHGQRVARPQRLAGGRQYR
ncbi:MAG: hypothetical protein AUG44_00790 [Actinobacteria bacterium 13_1_20CM_3_71_11]|nr:MAG: hypothetical protein AUG44_00790 [Actinobacteria bacterium 13_1_20CM_3_71_11]